MSAFVYVRTQDGSVLARDPDSGVVASGPTLAIAERRLAKKRNVGLPRLPSSQNRKPTA